MAIFEGIDHLQVFCLFFVGFFCGGVTIKTDCFLGSINILGIFGGIVRIGVRNFCCTDSCFYLVLTALFFAVNQFSADKVKTELLLETV